MNMPALAPGGSDVVNAISSDSGGSLLLASSQWNGGANVPTVAKLDPSGALVWMEPAFIGDASAGSANAVLTDASGASYFAGTGLYGTTYHGWVSRFDAAGSQTWLQTTQNSGYFSEGLKAIAFDPWQRVVVAGCAFTTPTNEDFFLARFSDTGIPIWSTTYDGPAAASDAARFLAIDKWGSIYALGPVGGGSGRENYGLLKLAPTGATMWPDFGDVCFHGAAIFDGTGAGNSVPVGVGVDSRGNVYVSGQTTGAKGTYDLHTVKYGLTDDAAFVGQSVPAEMIAGLTYQVSVQFQNTGNTVWNNPDGYKIGSLNPTDNKAWGINRVSVPFGDSISKGQIETFTFKVTAPLAGGAYNFQWRMRTGFGPFGAASDNAVVSVEQLPDEAAYVSQSIPSSVKAGSTFTVSVKMRNVGSNPWTPGAYDLVPASGSANWSSAGASLSSSETIPDGGYKTFSTPCRAPSTKGSYKMQWQMSGPNGVFYQATPVKTVSVG
jgi:hypothetical protein